MQSQKLDTQLNLALETPAQQRQRSLDLAVGYDSQLQEWELIIRYIGEIDFLQTRYGATIVYLLGGYAVITIAERYIDELITYDEIIYVEKPNNIFVNAQEGIRDSCITRLTLPDYDLTGDGVIVAVIDSGIDYTHPDFLNDDRTTRILAMWDQSAVASEENRPPEGYQTGVLYEAQQINEALQQTTLSNRLKVVPEVDLSGHGTFVAGVAAGNGRASQGENRGVAVKASLLVVKLAVSRERGFPRTTELMTAVDFVVKEAIRRNMPIAINLSFGNNYGSHDGTSLLETYLDVAANAAQTVLSIGSGNEGDTGRHASYFIQKEVGQIAAFSVAPNERALTVQIWKNYVDEYEIFIIAPDDTRIGPLQPVLGAARYQLMNTELDIYYGMPKPYQQAQEIYIDMIPVKETITPGEWRIVLQPVRIVDGRVDLWLPVSGALNASTRFLMPAVDTSITIPGTTRNAITVGAYNGAVDAMAPFSGRGFTRVQDVKPDIVAPGVGIISCAPSGGYTVKSGTSVATPFVTGSAALLMQWGILQKNDVYLYGEKMKAYFLKGARHLSGFAQWPNPQAGWGALCVRNSLP